MSDQYIFEKIGITSDYYIRDTSISDWERSIVAIVNGWDNVTAILELLNKD